MGGALAEPITLSITNQLLKDKVLLSLVDRLRCFRSRILEIDGLSTQGFDAHREEFYKLSDLSLTYRDSLSRRIIEVIDDVIRNPEKVVIDLPPEPDGPSPAGKLDNKPQTSSREAADSLASDSVEEEMNTNETQHSKEVTHCQDQASTELVTEEDLSALSQSTECCDTQPYVLLPKSDESGKYYSFTTLSGRSRKFYLDGLFNKVGFKLKKIEELPFWAYNLRCFLRRNRFDNLLSLKRNTKLPLDQNYLLISILNKSFHRKFRRHSVFKHDVVELVHQLWDEYESRAPAESLAKDWAELNISLGCSDLHFAKTCLIDMVHREMYSQRELKAIDNTHINFMIMNSLDEELRLYLSVFDHRFEKCDLKTMKPKNLVRIVINSISHYQRTIPGGISSRSNCRICLSRLHGTKSCKSMLVGDTRSSDSSSECPPLSDHDEDSLEKSVDQREKEEEEEEREREKSKDKERKRYKKKHIRNKIPDKQEQVDQRITIGKIN